MSGWIKLHRSLKEWEWYDDSACVLLLVHLLVSVNYETKKWKGITIEAGSMVLSWDSVAKGSKLSIQQCRTAMRKLENSGEVTRKATNKYQVITLTKWEKLQHISEESTSKPTIKQQSNNKQSTTTKEIKNNKEIKEDKNKEIIFICHVSDETQLSEHEFMAYSFFWLFKKNMNDLGIENTATLDKAKLKPWANQIRLMIESDKRTVEEAREVFRFLQVNDFWKKNILSASKLRKQFEKLIFQARQQSTSQFKQTYGVGEDYIQKLKQELNEEFSK